ncbi:MAG: hypothetical protein RMX68_010860 [Aulosira sp. ZfuVER01]|nr:hypothetical protein [Aulosira sp. ZfuVER01]MDZ7999816.1 hypothetical protein [Aulosira sp. DedVER01a]MDZ8053839.1 hypothetical protein [Aulosira sp. ZfuCHP01]
MSRCSSACASASVGRTTTKADRPKRTGWGSDRGRLKTCLIT